TTKWRANQKKWNQVHSPQPHGCLMAATWLPAVPGFAQHCSTLSLTPTASQRLPRTLQQLLIVHSSFITSHLWELGHFHCRIGEFGSEPFKLLLIQSLHVFLGQSLYSHTLSIARNMVIC